MDNHLINDTDSDFEIAEKLAEEEAGIHRKPQGWAAYVIPTIAVTWSIFQLAIAKWVTLSSTYTRAIHLAFALLIVFLNYPTFKKSRFGLKMLSATNRIPLIDWVLAGVASWSALYLIINYESIVNRIGQPIFMDIVAGSVLLVLLLEAARRVI